MEFGLGFFVAGIGKAEPLGSADLQRHKPHRTDETDPVTRTTSSRSGGIWSLLTETRVGSTTPLGCVIQIIGTGLAVALITWLLLTFA